MTDAETGAAGVEVPRPEIAALLAGIARHRGEFSDAGAASESLRTLPPAAVQTLRDLGVFWLKTPAELGGTPASPLEFCDVVEELAYVDSSTAWTAMIGAGCNGLAAGWLPAEGARRVFAPDAPLPVVAGQLVPRGTGRPADGGYVVSGRWGFSSGILHADWLIGAFTAEAGSGAIRVFVIPKEQAEVIDNWHVAGLQGTGSLDWTISGRFVPAAQTYSLGAPAVRGGALFRLGMPAFVSNEVPPLCVGLARRALDDMTELAGRTARFPGAPTLSERAVFWKELGRADARLRAARLLHRDAMATAWQTAVSGATAGPEEQLAVTTASVYAVETCAEVVTDLFRYGGGRVLSLASPMQRHLRNVLAARQHLALTEEHYEAAGRARIESAKPRRP